MDDLECAGFEFFSNFDSANLSRVEYVPCFESATQSSRSTLQDVHDVEFNIWTKPDCFGTEFENANRTWFYFGIRANAPELVVKLNLVDLNRQGKMYSQGMAPVFRIVPGKLQWERVRDKPSYSMNDNIFTLSFKYKTPENVQSIVYFAFTYPYSYAELINTLNTNDERFLDKAVLSRDDIYYVREAICFSLEGRRVELLTISSYHNISNEREARLKDLFPEKHVLRPFRFIGKKVIFISARVHPGETPSSFVFNGILNLLLSVDNPVAIVLRRLYVFKLIPMLNPDGVARGHYRTDTRGVNLNRMYLNPSLTLHPSIFAARALIRYHHFGYEKEDHFCETIDLPNDNDDISSMEDNHGGNDHKLSKRVSHMTLEENKNTDSITNCYCKYEANVTEVEKSEPEVSNEITNINNGVSFSAEKGLTENHENKISKVADDDENTEYGDLNSNESGLFMYLDMHGHASKKGIFMYGNHFEDFERNIDCMLLPKIMSINNFNFHFTACNFTERNMYLKDRRDGMSREGSGRVAVLKLTGLVRSYTLECNYNTGSLVNVLPSTIKESGRGVHTIPIPPKYNPHIFEEVGKTLGASILDLTGDNPITRLPNSQFHSLNGVRDWLKMHCVNELGETRCVPARFKLRKSSSLRAQGKSLRGAVLKTRSPSIRDAKRIMVKAVHSTSVVPVERKENICASSPRNSSQPSCSNIVTVPRPRPKVLFDSTRSKSRKESTLKLKGNTTVEKSKSASNVKHSQSRHNATKLKSVKLDAIKEKEQKGTNTENPSRLKLHEICFLKGTEGKRMIAKYKGKCDGRKGSDSDLIVQWDSHNAAQVFSHKVKGYGIKALPSLGGDPGPTKGLFRVYNFSKSKKSKRPLRRLASSNDVPTKIDKHKKRRTLKGQTS
uniref:tubulin-glutamate carboxypeptidase n=1 Tax=Photinus pyralis TaxID=7054 RepID=A0A1Y1L9X4_PHOPY